MSAVRLVSVPSIGRRSNPRARGAHQRLVPVLALATWALAGCPASEETSSEAPPPPATTTTSTAIAYTPASPPPPPVRADTLEALAPAINEYSEPGQTPDRVEIRFTRPVVEAADTKVTSETEITIKPEVEGQWTFKDRSTLVFKPKVGFRPGTSYLFTLKALQGEGEQARITGERTFQRVFSTPKLILRRLEVIRWREKDGLAEFLLHFSGPVNITKSDDLRWKVDGIRRKLDVVKGTRPDQWKARIEDKGLKPASLIEVAVRGSGIRSAVDTTLSASGSAQAKLPRGKTMFIRSVGLVEGANGFFIKVVCHDEASTGKQLGFWDRDLQEYFEVSPRCLIDEDSIATKLSFEPAVDVEVSPTRGGFRILGPFKRGDLLMKLAAGVRTVDGASLPSDYEYDLTVPARRPKLELVAQGRYLPSSAWGTLALRHQNVDEVEVHVRQVTRDNIVRWLSDGGQGTSNNNSDLVFKRRIKVQGKADVLSTTALPLKEFLPQPPPGVVELQVMDVKLRAKRAMARFAVTDLNMLAKRAGDGKVRVWVLGTHDHRPVAGAKVESVVFSGRKISTCTTDEAGSCVLRGVPKGSVDETEPFALVARSETDFTFIRFDQLKLDISGYDVQGAAPSRRNPYRASVYSDRGVYRPGDTAHIVAIIRGRDNRGPQKGMPVQVELRDPKRKVSKRRNLKTNEAGMVATDFVFADFADTGRYQAVFKAGKREVGRYAFNVEEFVPERMEVTATTTTADFAADQIATINVNARYLFGGSAAGSRFEVRCELAPTRFAPSQHPGYTFDAWRDKPARAVTLGQTTGTLGEQGIGNLACPSLTGRGRFQSASRLRASVSVFESGSGRTTRGETTAIVHPHPVYIGLKSSVDQVKRDRAFTVDGVVVDWDGKVSKALDKVTLELHKVEREYGWTYDQLEGRWINRRYAHLVRTQRIEVPVKKGRFSKALTTPESASAYVVRAYSGDVQGDLELAGTWSYWWYYGDYGGGGEDATPRPQKPGTLEIAAPAETAVGQTVKVAAKVPFAGRLLWTVESSDVKKSEWVDVTPGEVAWSFKVDGFEPNVYVSALLLKDPHEESEQSFLPSRAYGVRSVRIRPEKYLQQVQIRAPTEVRSNASFEVEVDLPDADRPMFVTVAAVDEGILSLTRFKTPDPAKELFKRRALGVRTFETIGWNVTLPAGDLGRSTGGGGPGAPGRVQMVKPVALWSGLMRVPDEGPLKVKFDVPQYRGKLRIMVVGAGRAKLVSASKSVLVRDPIVLQATLPRFLIQGDEVKVPVFLTNLSGKAQTVSVSFTSETLPIAGDFGKLSGAAEAVVVRGAKIRKVELPKDGQQTVIYSLDAKAAVGAARLTIEAKTPDLSVRESLDVPFSVDAPRTKVIKRMALEPGELNLIPEIPGWLPTTETTTFWVTSNPYGEIFGHLTYLIRYPYGCVEQTTSATRPMLFLGQLVRNVDAKAFTQGKLERRVRRGLDRVLSMQTASGGFGYWPGAARPVHWGTAYATHMLIDAKKQNFAVPQARIDEALAWMKRALSTADNREEVKDAAPYMHYVLALGGQGLRGEMRDLLKTVQEEKPRKYHPQREIDERVFLLKAGLFVAGNREFEADLLKPDLSPIESDRSNRWSFYSDQRRRGLMLSILVDMFGRRAELEPLAQAVAAGLRGHPSYWYSTQELVWGVSGLGKMLGEVTRSFAPPTLLANGEEAAPKWTPKDKKKDLGDRSFTVYRAGEYDTMVLKANHKPDEKVFLVLTSEGIKPNGVWKTGGQGVSVKRTYRDQRGEVLKPRDPVDLGDLIYVEITIRNKTAERIQNVAVVDRFGAALEVENPRLGRDVRTDWLDKKDRWYPEYMNLRDDRVEAFGTLGPRRSVKLVYLVRAVTAGTFSTPPVEVEAMYDPSIWARQRGGKMTVVGPWDE